MAIRPTPHSIALGTLIALSSDPSFDLSDTSEEEKADFSKGLAGFLQDVVLGNEQDNHMSLDELSHQVEIRAGKKSKELLLQYVEMSTSSVDALIDLVDSLRASVTEGIVDEASANGVYLRKLCLGFDELPFASVTRLWKALSKSMKQLKKRLLSKTHDQGRNQTGEEKAESWPPTNDLERILRSQTLSLETRDVQKSFEDIEISLQDILSREPELPAAHFMRFLNFLKNGERVGAIDSLHQYFDYAMIKERKNSTSEQKNDVLQYAAILLASVYSSFGFTDLSFDATEEAVRVAQASGDQASVAYALGWLYYNSKQFAREEELLRRCASRALDNKLRPLAGGANLALARHFLTAEHVNQKGEQPLPAHAWESLISSSTENSASESSLSAATASMDKPTHITDFPSSADALAILAKQCLVGSGIWDASGLVSMSALSSFTALHCYMDDITSQEVSAALQGVARVAIHGQGAKCIALESNLGVLRLEPQSDQTFEDDQKCVYAQALRKIISNHETYANPVNHALTSSAILVLHEWAVRRGELSHARAWAYLLHSNLHPRMSGYQEIVLETYAQRGLLLSREGEWEKAESLMKRLCAFCKKEGLRTEHARFLIQLAAIKIDSCPNECAGAMEPLLDCLTICEKYAMDSLHATALSLLARVHLQLKSVGRATASIKAALPILLRDAHVWYQGEAYLTLVKCELFKATKCHASSKNFQKTKRLRRASTLLELSQALFEKCHDVTRLQEVFYLQARVQHSVPGQESKRDQSSKRFQQASLHLEKCRSMNCSDPLQSVTEIDYLESLASRPLPV